MTGILKLVAVCFMASFVSIAGLGDILYWMVDEHASVHGADGERVSDVYTFLVPVEWTAEDKRPRPDGDGVGDAIVAARVNVCDAQGNVLKTLENVFGNIVDDSWHSPVDIGHPSSPAGVGASARSSNLNNNQGNLDLYYQVAILSRVSGEWNSGVFTEIAWSALYSGELLQQEGSYALTDDILQQLVAWVPSEFYTTRPVPAYDHYAAPEPSTGVLTLLGAAILMLKRKP